MNAVGLRTIDRDDQHVLFVGRLRDELLLSTVQGLDTLWDIHPEERSKKVVRGRPVTTRRWEQAYDREYRFAGNVSRAKPLPGTLRHFLD